MSVLPIRPVTTATTLAETLREELLSGAYAPGTPLGDVELVERDRASTGTARAALSELEHDGLVVHSLHRGVEVVRITPDEVRDIYAARRVFEIAGLEALLRQRPVDVTLAGGRDRAHGRGRGRRPTDARWWRPTWRSTWRSSLPPARGG